MKVLGLITEYNPFHNGHKYHIEEAKRISGADYVIAVMSGNFVQRGIPAVIDKYSRTQMAINNGVDLVLELPVCYSTSSAEYFAHGSISLLDKLGIVDCICFGSECGDIDLLKTAASFLLNPPAAFEEALQGFIKEGLTYPAARSKALEQSLATYLFPSQPFSDKQATDVTNKLNFSLSKVLSEPNNILGIEYMKALMKFQSKIKAFTIQRIAAHYHDGNLKENISSATAIRKAIHSKSEASTDYFQEMSNSVPEDVFRILKEQFKVVYPITEEDFSQIIKYKLMSEDAESLTEYLDITKDLADRMKKITDYQMSIGELTSKIKTKNMTLTRISRALIHLLLNIKATSFAEYQKEGYVPYARVLGVRKEATHLLRSIEAREQIPVITKVSRAYKQLNPLSLRMLSEDIFATHLYNQIVYEKYGTILPNEYKQGIILK